MLSIELIYDTYSEYKITSRNLLKEERKERGMGEGRKREKNKRENRLKIWKGKSQVDIVGLNMDKMFSVLLITWYIQIKTATESYFTPIRLSNTSLSDNTWL